MAYYNKLKKFEKIKNHLEKELNREPEKEELKVVLETEDIYDDIEVLENLKIDEEENQMQIKYKLGIKNYNLEKTRLDKKLLQKDVAKKLDINISTYSSIECCRVYPNEVLQIKISDLFKKSINYLFPDWLEILTENWKRAEKEKIVSHKYISLNSPEMLSLQSPIDLEDNANKAILKDILKPIINSLSPREQKILEMRFGLVDGVARTLAEVGQEFCVTGTRIRDVEGRALNKVKKMLPENFNY